MAAVMRAAIYLRVSTKEQTTENQERELRAWADRLGLEKVRVYAETASGARGDRAALAQVLAGAHRREYDTLLIWALDRLSREGIGAMARYLEELKRVGVRVMSYREPWLDTAGPVGELLVAVFAWVASQERARHIERVLSGQARAREAGIHLGRPRRIVDLSAVSARREAGETWREIAVALKIPTRTLRRHAEAGQKYLSDPQVRDLREPA